MKAFVFKYGYIICLLFIIVILVINYIVLMENVTEETALTGNGAGAVTVIIDAGHGGEDGGAVSLTGALEKDINLDIALKTEQIMALCGISPEMTRDSDIIDYPESAKTTRARKTADTNRRAELVNSTDRCVFISIHQNKYGSNTSPHGAQVFYAPTDGSHAFAEKIQGIFLTELDTSNKRTAVQIPDEIYIMNHINCPAVLIECGFLSNQDEAYRLETQEYQIKLAAAVTAGYLSSADIFAEIYFGGTNET